MARRYILALFLSLLFASTAYSQRHFVAFLTDELQVEEHPVPGRGYANLVLNSDSTAIDYSVSVWGLSGDIEAGHIHKSPAGTTGEVVKPITFERNVTSVGRWTADDPLYPLTRDLIDSLFAGSLYVNVHTMANPGGEIRGQIIRPNAFVALADWEQEQPSPGELPAVGVAVAVQSVSDHAGNSASDSLVFFRAHATGFSSPVTAAHIHRGEMKQAGAPVKTTVFDTSMGSTTLYWTSRDSSEKLTSQNLIDLQSGGLYWNVHTVLHPTGEIRGQLTKKFDLEEPQWVADSSVIFMSMLSGPQEGVEGIPSTATGTAIFQLGPDPEAKGALRFTIVAVGKGMTGPIIDAHVHRGDATVSGGAVVVPLLATDFGAVGEWRSDQATRPLGAAQVDSLFRGLYYINLHSTKFPAGEIRGQIIPLGEPKQWFSQPNNVAIEEEDAATLRVYPNPTADRITLPQELAGSNATLFNSLGEAVLQHTIGQDGSLSIGEIPAGAYKLRVVTREGARSSKIVKLPASN